MTSQDNNSTFIKETSILSNDQLSIINSDRNLFCIWYFDNDLREDIQFIMKTRLNNIFTYFCIFNDLCEFATYLISPLVVTKIYFIITSSRNEYLCSIAKNRPQHKKTYQFQPYASSTDNSLVFIDLDQLFMEISKDIKMDLNSMDQSLMKSCCESVISPPLTVWNCKRNENSFQCWKKESPEFFLFQALSRFLIRLKCDPDQSLKEMISACREEYINNTVVVHKIDQIENDYKNQNPIWFYTLDSFLFRSMGKAFRSEDFENIFIFRRYIIDLHWQLHIYSKERHISHKISPLYRGKKLSTAALQQLQDNVGSLISINGFLSTTFKKNLALDVYAGVGQDRPGYISVLFEFFIDETIITKIYANISEISQFQVEEEVLFTMGSIWYIDSINNYNDLYWIVKLSSYNDDNLKILQFFEDLADDSPLLMLGDVLLALGQFTKAENFYYRMLDEPTINNEIQATLYYNIAMVNIKEGKYPAALRNLQEAEKLISTRMIHTKPLITTFQPLYCYSIARSPISIYNNMALLYQKKGNAERALEYFLKALNDENSDPIDKATVYDNIGSLHYTKGKYQDALKYISQAIKLAQDHSSLPKFIQHYNAIEKHLLYSNISSVEELHLSNNN